MAGIYNRDNIQYAPMIQNAIANAKETGATRAKYSKNQYDIAADLARAGARTAESYFSEDPDRAGWASYIMSGDRSALEAARARAQQKAAQDAQFAQQTAMQKAQQAHAKELQANQIASAEKLAKIQRETQSEFDRDAARTKWNNLLIDAEKFDQNGDPSSAAKMRNEAALLEKKWGFGQAEENKVDVPRVESEIKTANDAPEASTTEVISTDVKSETTPNKTNRFSGKKLFQMKKYAAIKDIGEKEKEEVLSWAETQDPTEDLQKIIDNVERLTPKQVRWRKRIEEINKAEKKFGMLTAAEKAERKELTAKLAKEGE